MMKRLLLLLFMISLSFAAPAWHEAVAVAIFASILLLLVIYMLAFGFGIDSLKATTKEEFYQLIITVVLVVVLFSLDEITNSLSPFFSGEAVPQSIQDVALNRLDTVSGNMSSIYTNLYDFSFNVAHQSSKSFYCNLLSVGVSISPCAAYGMVLPPVSLAVQAVSLAIAELQALSLLLELGVRYSFVVFLPLGLLLRSLHFTRGAGGLFIALGISLYLILPLSILFLDDLSNYFIAKNVEYSTLKKLNTGTRCDERSVKEENYTNPQSIFSGLQDNVDVYLFFVFVKATFLTIISLLIVLTSLKWLTAAGGATVDITPLMRLV